MLTTICRNLTLDTKTSVVVTKKSNHFAITAYDPDAPTGSDRWHWQVVNIPMNVLELATGTGDIKTGIAPAASVQMHNDYGSRGFGGACPPEGHGIHHYRFTVYALSVEKLALPEHASGALTGYMINAHTIGSSTLEVWYRRDLPSINPFTLRSSLIRR